MEPMSADTNAAAPGSRHDAAGRWRRPGSTRWRRGAAGLLMATAAIAAGLAAPTAAYGANTPTTLYAYATGAATNPTSCPSTGTQSGQCTLGEALGLASGGDTVELATPGATAAYVGNWTVDPTGTSATSPLTIAPASGVSEPTLSGNGGKATGCTTAACDGPVLTIGTGVNADITGVIVENADNTATSGYQVGGGIDNNGTLAVTGSTFDNDKAGVAGGAIGNGDYSSGAALTVSGSTFTGDTAGDIGGSIANGASGAGTAMVRDSTFTDNAASGGGAISNAQEGTGSLTVTDSTFADNTATDGGGAIDNGALTTSTGIDATITRSTFVDNTSADNEGTITNALGSGTGNLSVESSTLVATSKKNLINGYAHPSLSNPPSVTVGADVFAGGPCLATGTWTDLGYSVGTLGSCFGPSPVTSDVTDANLASQLGSLADNGGPTQTVLPVTPNPAIGLIPDPTTAGTSPLCPFTDQRGVPSGSQPCSAGSVQLDPQAISWTAPSSGVADTTVTLSATGGGSDNPVVFAVASSSGAGVCSVSGTDGTTLDYAKAGSCVVDASQAGGPADEPLYAAAPTVTQTITVAPPTYIWSGADSATTSNWSDPKNWQGDQAPVAGTEANLVFPANACTSTAACSPVDDLSGVVVGTLTIDNPDVPSTPTYSISGKPFTLDGGITATSDNLHGALIFDDIALGGPNHWTVTASSVDISAALSAGTDKVTGEPYGLTIDLSPGSSVNLYQGGEVGPVAVTSSTSTLGSPPATFYAYGGLNGTDGQPVTTSDVLVDAGGAFGPLSVHGGVLTAGTQGGAGHGTLAVAGGLNVGPHARLSATLLGATAVAGDDSRFDASHAATVTGAHLVLSAACDLSPGASFTLLDASGGITGPLYYGRTDTPVTNGLVVQSAPAHQDQACTSSQQPPYVQFGVTSTTITATVVAPLPSPSPVTAVPLPALTGVAPASGSTAGGTVVTLSGTSLCSPSQVDFGSVTGTAVTVNAGCTTLTVTDPAQSAGTVPITVTTAGGTSNGEPFTYVAPTPVIKASGSPTITAIAPTSGAPGGGETVTLTGTGLCDPTSVDFGSVPGTAVTVNTSCTMLTVVDPPGSGTVAVVVSTATGSAAAPTEFTYITPGYWTVTSNGSVYSFGGAKFYGSLPSIGVVPNAPIVAMADTPDHGGYWLFSADGGVFAFGDAQFYGSVPGVLGPEHRSLNKPIVAAEAMANGQGYRLFAADGGVFDFGDAGFVGALPCSAPGAPGGLCVVPNKPIESAVSNPLGQGYWLVGGDGGVFALGDAPFFGSLGAQQTSDAIVSMAATPDGQGYWIFGATGSVHVYGDATNYGSILGQIPMSAPIAAGAATTNGRGYWLFGQNGGVYAFGSAPFNGSLQSLDTTPSGLIVGGIGF